MKKAILSLFLSVSVLMGFGQVTTSSISGVVKNEKQEVLAGTVVEAIHVPTGTKYKTVANKNGVYVLPAVRVGGPYVIHASFVGFKKSEETDVNAQLGVTTNVDFALVDEKSTLKEVVVTGTKSVLFSKEKTGAAQQFGRDYTSAPTITLTGVGSAAVISSSIYGYLTPTASISHIFIVSKF